MSAKTTAKDKAYDELVFLLEQDRIRYNNLLEAYRKVKNKPVKTVYDYSILELLRATMVKFWGKLKRKPD